MHICSMRIKMQIWTELIMPTLVFQTLQNNNFVSVIALTHDWSSSKTWHSHPSKVAYVSCCLLICETISCHSIKLALQICLPLKDSPLGPSHRFYNRVDWSHSDYVRSLFFVIQLFPEFSSQRQTCLWLWSHANARNQFEGPNRIKTTYKGSGWMQIECALAMNAHFVWTLECAFNADSWTSVLV